MPEDKFVLSPEAATMSPRDLAAQAQTDVTPDHTDAIAWGKAAYARATEPTIQQNDPKLAGEVARNVALRHELADEPVELAAIWLRRSLLALRDDSNPAVQREQAATFLIRGRITYRQHRLGRASITTSYVRDAFNEGEAKLRAQHSEERRRQGGWLRRPFGVRWDRYGTMSARHWATLEGDENVDGTQPVRAVPPVRGLRRKARGRLIDP